MSKLIINEATTSTEFATVEMSDSIIEIDKNTFDSFLSDITNYGVIDTPSVKIYNVISHYNHDDKLSYYNSALIQLEKDCSYLAENIVTFNGVSVEIIYFEGPFVLVKLVDASKLDLFVSTTINTTDGVHTIIGVNNNITFVTQMLREYTGKYTVSDGEYLDNTLKTIDLTFISNSLSLSTRKIPTKMTREFVEDLKLIFDQDAKDVIMSEVSDIMTREIEIEVLQYLKTKAKKYGTLVLSNSYGVQNELAGVATDIYAGIRTLANNISTDIKRKKDLFIIADSNTCSLMLSSPLFQKASDGEGTEKSTLLLGTIGVFELYMDAYSVEEYVMVGYKNKKSKLDAGLIFRLYNEIHITESVDPDNGNMIYWMYVRYGYVQNPQTTNADNSSMFFSMFNIDSSGLLNFPLKRVVS